MSDTSENRSLKEVMRLTKAKLNRLSWALNTYGEMLSAAVRQDTSAEAREVEKLPDEQVTEHVAQMIQEKADPTVAKTMTGWLVKQYAHGALRLEDLGTAYETLTMFQRYALRLPKGEQDLGQYPSLAKVWEVVAPLAEAEQDKLSGKAQKVIDKTKAYAESQILRQDEDGFTIAVPLTEFAAKWWGRGTRWCTAGQKDNQFRYYHEQGPLIVVVIPELKEKGKFQLWVTKGDVQFMDAADQRPSEDLIAEYWPRFKPLMLHAVAQNGRALEYVPEKLRTDEMYRIAVAQDGWRLQYVPERLCTVEMCRIAVAQHGWILQYVPEALSTDEICRIAVAQSGDALYYVSQKLRTEDLCKVAVAQNGGALQFVPENLRTDELCKIAVAQNVGALQYVPEDLRADEMYRIAVARNGRALEDVPDDLRTDELCKIAVAQNGAALEYVPEKLRTDEMYRVAMARNGRGLHYVPEDLRTEDICRLAVAQNGLALKHVPEKLRTDEMYRIAMAKNGRALHFVPQTLRTDEMCRIAVAQDGSALNYVPDDLRTDEICRIAVAQNGGALIHVPEALRTEEMCKIAVGQNGRALEYMPEALRDQMSNLTPASIPVWDISLLDDMVSLLSTVSFAVLSGPRHA